MPLTPGDLPQLQATLAGWIAAAGSSGYCHPGELAHRIAVEGRRGVPFDQQILIAGDAPAISAIGILFRFGAAFDLFVAPELRGSATERGLLHIAATRTAQLIARHGTPDTPVITDVCYRDTIRRQLLSQIGFSHYREWDAITTRSLNPLPGAAILAEGFGIRHATAHDAAGLAWVINAAFNDDWTPEQYREYVLDAPGYGARRHLVAIAPDGQIAACVVLWLDEQTRIGQFEPVATHPSYRRQGLARALLISGMHQMQQAGMHTAALNYQLDNHAAAALYRNLGFIINDHTLGYQQTQP
ncbi:MAG TPA: GNAT family N-acetyltransferase [Roseiflexaceae bacterium]|nr:GNAT family N-acetyltransferase [Roseiflexaceae bacterium]HMP42966.1 GNAT family N-acetyltransferase [Roseiflexaceae bacterium]